MDSQLQQTVTAALASLPHSYQQLLTLRDNDGIPTETVSGILGITANEARVELLHARRAMRQRLSDWLRVEARR